MTVSQANNTLSFIRKKVRRLSALSGESSLSTNDLDDYINRFYSQDFPYAIKLDQTRQVYTFLTIPNVDRYPVDVNNNMGFRAPVYFQGIQGNFFKNRDQLFNLYPRYPTQFQQGIPTVSGTITGIAQPTNPTQITSPNHNLATGAIISISNVGGMTQLNGNTYTITVVNANEFTLNGIDNTPYGAYTTGGTWITTNTSVSFNLFYNVPGQFPAPNFGILSTQVVIGGIDINGNPIRIVDDGGALVNSNGIGANTTTGQLIFVTQNAVGNNVYSQSGNQIPSITNLSPLGGQQNANYPPNTTYPPSPLTPQYCGTVNYISTQIDLTLPVPVMPGTQLNIWAATYTPGRPYNLLFWNNEFTIRPVPDNVYKVEIESYLSPTQFMAVTDIPALTQWVQYISYGVAAEILRDRGDWEGVAEMQEGFKRQEGLVLERQANEEIFQPNIQLFNSTQQSIGFGAGLGAFY